MSDSMNSCETEIKTKSGLGESRFALVLLGLVALLVILVPLLVARGSVFLGGGPDAQHAEVKARQEIKRRFDEGVMMLHAKQYSHALTAFHRVLALDPKMPEAHVNIGFALLGLKQPKAAADFFDTATIIRPTQLNAYFGLGEALDQLGDKLGALQSMETYLHRAPQDDPFRMKAEAAVWELRAALAEEAKGKAANTQMPVEGSK